MEKYQYQTKWKIISYIFSKPLLASLTVGISIHAFTALNEYVGNSINYFDATLNALNNNAVCKIISLLIPFLVPWIVTKIGNKLIVQKERTSLLKFPDANPNVVFKMNDSGEILYMNPAAESQIKREGLEISEAELIFPENYRDIIKEITGTDKSITTEKTVKTKTLEFIFKAFEDEKNIFITGRDISKRKNYENQITESYNNLLYLYNFMDKTFAEYEPLFFNLDSHYKIIMRHLLRDISDREAGKPLYIFLTFQDDNGNFCGHLHWEENGIVVMDKKLITVKPVSDKVAITQGSEDVIWSNWETENTTLQEYQLNFHPDVRERIGEINRFTTYISGKTAIVAFNHGKIINEFDAFLLKGLAIYANSLKRISEETNETEEAFNYTVNALARASEANDEDTGEHIIRINEYSKLLSEKLGMDKDFTEQIHVVAQVHDVGKIHVHPDILKKRGKLTEEEFTIMKNHTIYGAHILGDSPRLKMASEIAITHHEKYDGTGYPYGLKGEEVPISGSIVTVVDVYDALRQERSYKPEFSHEKAMDIITKGDGRVEPSGFNPDILDSFKKIQEDMNNIFEDYRESAEPKNHASHFEESSDQPGTEN